MFLKDVQPGQYVRMGHARFVVRSVFTEGGSTAVTWHGVDRQSGFARNGRFARPSLTTVEVLS